MNIEVKRSDTLPQAVERARLLLVDDHEVGRVALARLLRAIGYDVTAVGDGTSACEALESLPPFAFVLTDVSLPDFDGREVVRAAKQKTPVPWIALVTGWDIDPVEKSRLGVDWVFLKPLDVQMIVEKLNESAR